MKDHRKKVFETAGIAIVAWLPFFVWQLGYQTRAVEQPATLSVPAPSVPRMVSTVRSTIPTWNQQPSVQAGPFGPIFAVELAQEFAKLPKPCNVKFSIAKDKKAFRDTLVWILYYGGASCAVKEESAPANVDEPAEPPLRTTAGMTIHWDKSFEPGAQMAHWFDASGFKVEISNRLPANSPKDLIWIDVGPGDPWK
jgi:hypothetical protein